jgi:hypothetical protein
MTRAARKPPVTPERRVEPRRRSSVSAWVSATGFGTARCRLLDLSDEGAQITAPIGLRVGDRVNLTLTSAGKRRAYVMWVEADIIGLRFITE